MSPSTPTPQSLRSTPFWLRSIALIRTIDRWSDRIGYLVMLTFIPMILAAVYEVVARYVFSAPTSWSTDVTFMANGTMFMLGGAYALLKGAHVRTDIYWDTFTERTKGRIDLITYLVFFLPTMALIFYISLDGTIYSFQIQERSNASLWQPILWPFRAVIPATALLLFAQGISEGLKSYWAVLTNEPFTTHEKIDI
jgi:TRAP-type mannitol/chloroaromatic compound transport system permease small subunit